jgi:hypothetical protein
MQSQNQAGESVCSPASKYLSSQAASIAVGISLPRDILDKIDSDRGDISRSRFLLRIIERVYSTNHTKKNTSQIDYIKIQECPE